MCFLAHIILCGSLPLMKRLFYFGQSVEEILIIGMAKKTGKQSSFHGLSSLGIVFACL